MFLFVSTFLLIFIFQPEDKGNKEKNDTRVDKSQYEAPKPQRQPRVSSI